MKKIWILEKFISVEDMRKSLEELLEIRKNVDGDENIMTADQMVESYEKKISENPDGYWLGYEGKSNYKQFCSCAKDFIWRHRTEVRKGEYKLRVVEGEIPNDAKYWPGYKIVKENRGVLNYLFATTL